MVRKLLLPGILIIFICVYMLWTFTKAADSAGGTEVSSLHILLYDSSCDKSCRAIIEKVFMSVDEEAGSALALVALDMDIPSNQAFVTSQLKQRDLSREMLTEEPPFLLTQGKLVAGVQPVEQALDQLVNQSSQDGSLLSLTSVVANDTGDDTNVSSTSIWSLAVLLFISLGLAILLFLRLSWDRLRVKFSRRPRHRIRYRSSETVQQSSSELVETLTGQRATKIDFLTEMVRIVHKYEKTGRVPEDAVFLARDMLEILKKHLGISTVEEYATWVEYDPAKHKSYQHYERGERVWVAEPGWQRRDRVYKRVVVQKMAR